LLWRGRLPSRWVGLIVIAALLAVGTAWFITRSVAFGD